MAETGAKNQREADEPGLIFDYPVQICVPGISPPPAAARRLRASAAAAVGVAVPEPASTFGWDTVFAISIADVNRELAKPGVCPPGFASQQGGIDVHGTFGPWQVCMGGGAENIHFSIPIPAGQLQFQGKTAAMDGATAVIELKLQYVPQPTSVKGGTPNHLVIRTTPDTPTGPVVSVLQLSFANPAGPGSMAKALMIGGLSDWFNANLQQFTHIFATVNLNERLAQGEYQWLAPTFTGYAYVDGANQQNSYLGVLCTTMGNSPAGLISQISAAAVPQGARAGFSISQKSFLAQMVMPSLPGAFPGSKASDFALSPDGSAVVNRNKVNTKTVEHGGFTYQPVVQKLGITVSGEILQISVETRTEISPGITTTVSNISYIGLHLDTSTGSPKLSWVQMRAPVSEHSTDVATGIKIVEAILAVIAFVITIILGILTDGAFFVIATIIVGLVIGFAAATPELIAAVAGGSVGSEVPSIDALVMNATDPIVWSGTSTLQVTSASLNGSFQIGGNPIFVN
jgi:hypothetical protein